MKVAIAFLILALALPKPAQAQTQPAAQKPLDKDQIMSLVRAGMESDELVKRIQDRGIDFELTNDYLDALRKAGAQDVLIQALRAARPTPLTQDQILKLVVSGVPSQRAATLVKQRGIDFLPDEKYLETLRLAGADEALVAAVRAAGELVMADLTVVTSPDAEVYLDGALQGRASAHGELAFMSKLGAHRLKVSLAGRKDFEENLTVAAGQANKLEAPLAYLLPPQPGEVRESLKDGLKYVWIPPGTFMMGCSPGDSECEEDEKPLHQVTISKGFRMGQTEVTVGAYKRFARGSGRAMPEEPRFKERALNSGWTNDAMPIVNVSWDDAVAYCAWAGVRLPTEAEWEYAARAGSTEVRYGPLDEIGWYADNSGASRIDSAHIWRDEENKYLERLRDNSNRMHEVAQKRANGFGLFDMLGNVWEWASDWYGENYYQGSPSRDPDGPGGGESRVLRGGPWGGFPKLVRTSLRFRSRPVNRNYNIGFRCAGEVNP